MPSKKLRILMLPLLMAWQAEARPPAADEVVFSELMIAPAYTYHDEWIELYVRAGEPVSLEGCEIVKEAGTCADSQTCKRYSFPAGLELQSGDFFLMSSRNQALYTDCEISADLVYGSSTLPLSNSDRETLRLLCGETEIARFTYDWDDWKKAGASNGQSIMLHPDHLADPAPSSPDLWCVASRESLPACTYQGGDSTTYQEFGTPGSSNTGCVEEADPTPTPTPTPPPDPIPEGAVLFNELAAWGSGSSNPEWIELYIAAAPEDGQYDLAGCELRTFGCDELGLSPADCLLVSEPVYKAAVKLGKTGDHFPVEVGRYAVLAARSTTAGFCLAADPADPGICLEEPDIPYSGLTLYNGGNYLLELACPADGGLFTMVDRIVYDNDLVEAKCGLDNEHCSWELIVDQLAALLELPPGEYGQVNDDQRKWGVAIADYLDPVGSAARGTPGRVNTAPAPSAHPGPGDVLFNEINAWPGTSSASTPEWLELYVTGEGEEGAQLELVGCSLRTLDCDDPDGDEATEDGLPPLACLEHEVAADAKSYPLAAVGGSSFLLEKGSEVLLSRSISSCVAYDPQDPAVCLAYPDLSYSSLSLFNSGTHRLELICPGEEGIVTVDRAVYSKPWADERCPATGASCSWSLRPGELDALIGLEGADRATVNDLPQAWASAESLYQLPPDSKNPASLLARGTPGVANAVPDRTETVLPSPGSIVFSEIMLAPAEYKEGDTTLKTPEWLELRGVGEAGEAFELGGCLLLQAKLAEAAACVPEEPESCAHAFALSEALHFPIQAFEQKLFVKDQDCLSYGEPDEDGSTCAVPADLRYSSLDFSAKEPQVVSLYCPDEQGAWQEIDRLEHDWTDFSVRCPVGQPVDAPVSTCSLAVHPEHLSAADNDDPFYQCVSPAGTVYFDLQGRRNIGTPGAENVCTLPNVPSEGEVVISELMISPVGDDAVVAQEWFELFNATGEVLDFTTCTFHVGKHMGEDELEIESSWQPAPVSIQAGDYQLWGRYGCLFSTDAKCVTAGGDTPGDEYLSADVGYDKLEFPASGPKVFWLECYREGGVTTRIDLIDFDVEASGLEDGHSWQVNTGQPDALANDDAANWCMATYQQKFFETTKGCNFGTPGEPNACPPPEPYDGPSPACRCDAGAGSSSPLSQGALALTAALFLVYLRRRPTPPGAR